MGHYRNNSTPRNTNRRFNLIPTKAGISRARAGKSTHAALPWQDEPWLLPHGAAQGKNLCSANPPRFAVARRIPKALERLSWFHQSGIPGTNGTHILQEQHWDTNCLADTAPGICCSVAWIQIQSQFPVPNHSVTPREFCLN